MRLSSITDIEFGEISTNPYDLAIFASGYESRCQFVSSKLNVKNVHRQIVFGFEYIGDDQLRAESDRHFQIKWGATPHILSSTDERRVYQLLNHELSIAEPRHILVDYSSMSRAWYAAILNWIRFSEFNEDIFIDFVYSAGAYSAEFSPIAVKSVLPLPGCEGSSGTTTKSVAIFGLGFEGLAPLCVLDKLQPDEIFAYLASPAADAEYPIIARRKNAELISQAKETLELPLSSVQVSFTKLSEVVMPYLKMADVTFVPMGPKPHVLAAILLAIRFEQVTCLHVNGRTQSAVDVSPSGDVIATRLHFKPNSD